jgi:predicted patatin/cPLA2 family phospholipase
MIDFHIYTKKLVDALPKKNQKIDLILDGGAFNGSYLLGVVYFLREMEKQKRLNIDRISCSSVGCFVALAHIGDCMELFSTILYRKSRDHFEVHLNLDVFDEIFDELRNHLPHDICERMSGKVYISFYNIKKAKKIVKNRFRSVDELFETIRRSCFVPFFINGYATYKNRYIDGMNPYFFVKEIKNESNENNKIEKIKSKSIKKQKNKEQRKTLYVDLFGYDKIMNIMDIKNEKTNEHRVFSGLLDVHMFYTKQVSTSMCSYVEEWSCLHHLHFTVKKTIEYLICIIIFLFQLFSKTLNASCFFKLFSKILNNINKTILKEYYV